MVGAEGEFWYPTVDDIVAIHDNIIEEDSDSEPGIRNRQQIEFVVDYIKHGFAGEGPETIHEKAFHLLRLLAANHWFVDGNKRTALNSTIVFYAMNHYRLRYGEDVGSMLRLISVREGLIKKSIAIEYLSEQTEKSGLAEFMAKFEGMEYRGLHIDKKHSK